MLSISNLTIYILKLYGTQMYTVQLMQKKFGSGVINV
jgi:hypothetical protein